MQLQRELKPSLSDMAVCLWECSEQQRQTNEFGHELFAPKRIAGEQDILEWAPGTRAAFAEMVRKQQMLFAAHLVLKEIGEHERAVRRLIAFRSWAMRVSRSVVRALQRLNGDNYAVRDRADRQRVGKEGSRERVLSRG